MRAFLTRAWGVRRALGLYLLILAAGWFVGEILRDLAVPDIRPGNEPTIHRILMVTLVLYVIAAAVPFVPGAEIGLALLLLFGAKAAPIVYAGMVGALLLSYGLARLVPIRAIARTAQWLGLRRPAELALEIEACPAEQRPDLLSGKVSGRISEKAIRNRYLLLALLLNLPGNSVVGGGGGLAFFAGVSGLYAFWQYLATVLIAVAPVPLFFYLQGS